MPLSRAREEQVRGARGRLGSEAKKRAKPRLRINFTHKDEANGTTRDEILGSLSRQQRMGLENGGEGARVNFLPTESAPYAGQGVPNGHVGNRRHNHAGRSAFILFAGGFLAIWAYGFLTKAYDIPGLSTLTQTPEAQIGIQIISSNPVPTGLILAGALLTSLYLRHRRKSSTSQNPQPLENALGWE